MRRLAAVFFVGVMGLSAGDEVREVDSHHMRGFLCGLLYASILAEKAQKIPDDASAREQYASFHCAEIEKAVLGK
jgi:hypothetical protein